jgi:hypothetical protein
MIACLLFILAVAFLLWTHVARPPFIIYYTPVLQTDFVHLPRSATFTRPQGFLNLQVVTKTTAREQLASDVSWQIKAADGRVECHDITDLRAAEDPRWHYNASMANLFGPRSCRGERSPGQKVLTIRSAVSHGPPRVCQINMYYVSSPTVWDRLHCWADMCIAPAPSLR